MVTAGAVRYRERATQAFEPVADMLDVGRCEPLKAAVHAVVLATVALCAAYNTAAWIKRRQRHLAINAVVYSAAVWWERTHIMQHLAECEPGAARLGTGHSGKTDSLPASGNRDAA
jgi:hypothetical protein